MTTIAIAILALAIGIYVGSIVFGKEVPTEPTEPKPDRNSPMVICMVFHKHLNKGELMEMLKPQAIRIARHFGLPFMPVDKELWDSLDPLADKIMKWYNPEYPELVLVAHRESPNSSVILNWTWAVPSHGAVDELGK